MNWVKTRLSVREEKLRMKQREFFANKKLEKQIPIKPGAGKSLDLLALNISNREKPKAANPAPPKVVKVDLDKLNPYRQRVKHVDLGPLSPTRRPVTLHADISSAHRNVISDASSVTWQPSSFLSSQPLPPASRSSSRDILSPLLLQSKFLQTTRQNENSRTTTKFNEKAQLSTFPSPAHSEPETPFVPFSKPGPRVTFNNKTETWSYSCTSSSSENSTKEKSRSPASAFPRAHLHEDSSATIPRRYLKDLFETEDFQDVPESCAMVNNRDRVKGCGNERRSTSDFDVLRESSCLAKKYHLQKNGSRFLRGTEYETKGRFLPTSKDRTEGHLLRFSEDNTLSEQNSGSLKIPAGRYSGDSQSEKLIGLYDDGHISDCSFGSSANYGSSHGLKRKLDSNRKDLVKCWISRDDDQPSAQSSYGSEAYHLERNKSEQDLLSESPFSQSSYDKCSRRSKVIEIRREDIDDWILRDKSEDVLKAKTLEVEPDVLFARNPPRHEGRKHQLSVDQMERAARDVTSTEQRRPLSLQSLLVEDSARSFTQEAKDSVGTDSPSQSGNDSSSDEKSSILSSCPSTKSFLQGRYCHQQQQQNNGRNHAAGNRPTKHCHRGAEERDVPNSWLLFVRGETQAPVTGSRQLPGATEAQVVTEQTTVIREHSCLENSSDSFKKSSTEKGITLTSDLMNRNYLQSPTMKDTDSECHKPGMAEDKESSSLLMTVPTHGNRSSSRMVTPELGDNNSVRMATDKHAETNCFSCHSIAPEPPQPDGVAVHVSHETVHSEAYIKEESDFGGVRNTAKCVNNLDDMTKDDDDDDEVRHNANIHSNDNAFSTDSEPPPKRYKFFRELVIGVSSSISVVNCETQTPSESPVLMTTNVKTSSSDVLSSSYIHSSHSAPLLVAAFTQTSPIPAPLTAIAQTSPIPAPLTTNASTSPAINGWTVDAQSSPVFGPLLSPIQSHTSLNCVGVVDVSLSPVFPPVQSSDAQLSPIFQYKTTDAQLSPISYSFGTDTQQSPLLDEESPKSRKCFASDVQSPPTMSSETSSDLPTLQLVSCDQLLEPLCEAEVNIETTIHAAEYSAQSKPAQNPSDVQGLHESDNCLDAITNKHDEVDSEPAVGFGSFVLEAMAAINEKSQMTMEEHTPRFGCCVRSEDDPSLYDVSFRSLEHHLHQNKDDVDKTDGFGCETISCSGGLQSSTSFEPMIGNKIIGVFDGVFDDVHDQDSKALAEESCIATTFEVDRLSETTDSQKLRDSNGLPSADPNGENVPDLVLFSSELSSPSVDKRGHHHLLDSSGSNSVYSSPMG